MGHYDEQREQHEEQLRKAKQVKNVSGVIITSRRFSGTLQAHIEISPIRNIGLLRASIVNLISAEGLSSEPHSYATSESARMVDVIHKINWDFKDTEGQTAIVTLLTYVDSNNSTAIISAKALLEKLIQKVSELPIPDEMSVITR